ncbi:hypothetical protein OUZ56_011423 [Daphnia magna]|uniref:Uncharacterized protein n=1 Tax=Daphnia magna TaxID=35525 RepID=A0ABQ9Z056_9CRUS|nr:hypothetical protein OUZ56_011423 [Daphnia magna]
MASPQAPPTPISKLSDMTPKLCVQNDPTRMRRAAFHLVSMWFILFIVRLNCKTPKNPRPNIVVILIDDLDYVLAGLKQIGMATVELQDSRTPKTHETIELQYLKYDIKCPTVELQHPTVEPRHPTVEPQHPTVKLH